MYNMLYALQFRDKSECACESMVGLLKIVLVALVTKQFFFFFFFWS